MTIYQKVIEFAKSEIGYRDKEELENLYELKISVSHVPGIVIEPKSYMVTFKKVKRDDRYIWEYLDITECS